MAEHVITEERAAHTKHIITVHPQLQALHLSFPLLRYYLWQEEDQRSF